MSRVRERNTHQPNRRTFLARLGALAGVAAGGLGGVAIGPTASAALPTRADPVITLRLGVDWEGLSAAANQVPQIMSEVFAHFSADHPGLRVAVTLGPCSNGPNNSCADCDMSATLAGLMAGDGLDVFSVCGNEQGLVDGGLVTPLLPLLRRDNVPLDTWPQNTIQSYMFNNDLYFLPSEEQPQVLTYNRAILDQLGLREPTPDWTYTEAADLWRSAAGTVNGKRRYGLMGMIPPYGLGRGWAWVFAGFGGSPQNATYTGATFDTPPNLAAAEWILEVVRANAVTGGDMYGNLSTFLSGQCVFANTPSWAIPDVASGLRGMDWSFIPYPVFPAGRATANDGNPYALSGTTKYPEAAWELLKWICVEPTYWRFEVRVSLNTPSQTALWPEFTAAVLTIAPDLQNRGLQWFADAQLKDYGFPAHPFAYADPQAEGIVGTWSGKIWTQQATPALAFAAIDRQVNALEASAGSISAAALKEAVATATQLRGVEDHTLASFGVPPRSGIGAPATAAAGLVTAKAGTYSLIGSGGGLHGTSDDGTLFAAASTAPSATFVCRLVAVSNVDEPKMDLGAKIGLMLRGDLSDDAPMAAAVVSGHEGVIFESRGVILVNASHQKLGNASSLFENFTAARGKNFLKAPLWLKIVRNVDLFSAFTSADGAHWIPAGTPTTVRLAGAWVGLFATSHESGKRIKATFDHLSGFVPDTPVSMGS